YGLDRDRRRDLAGVVTTHAVADQREVVAATVVLLDRDRVLVVVAGPAGVTGACHLNLEGPGVVGALEQLVHAAPRPNSIARSNFTAKRQPTRREARAGGGEPHDGMRGGTGYGPFIKTRPAKPAIR